MIEDDVQGEAVPQDHNYQEVANAMEAHYRKVKHER